MNDTVENIGARRLHTVLERVVEDISFEADDKSGETITIDVELVRKQIGDMLKTTDLQRFIL